MNHFTFKDYDGFKKLFPMKTDSKGEPYRYNKILLSWYKSKEVYSFCTRNNLDKLLNITSMTELYNRVIDIVSNMSRVKYSGENCSLMGLRLFSGTYATDSNQGLTSDLDPKRIRLKRLDETKFFKVKPGKFMKSVIDSSPIGKIIPEPVKLYVCEEFTRKWEAFVDEMTSETSLHTGDSLSDFEKIYTSSNYENKESFGSCMEDDGYEEFYANSVDAKAAWLENARGEIIARCVIYNEVYIEGSDKTLRIAERQYAHNDGARRLLVSKLIKAGLIDAYKKVGAGCHDTHAFEYIDGTPLSGDMYIFNSAESGDYITYQDTFKWLDPDEGVAYNYQNPQAYVELTNTDGTGDWGCWDDRHEEYCRETFLALHRTVSGWACFNVSTEYKDEYELINGDYYFKEDLDVCPNCGEYFLYEEGIYSELTDETYCCYDCLEEVEYEWHKEQGHILTETYHTWAESEEDVLFCLSLAGWDRVQCLTIAKEDVSVHYLQHVSGDYYRPNLDYAPEQLALMEEYIAAKEAA